MNAKRMSESFIAERLPAYSPASRDKTRTDIEGLKKSNKPVDQRKYAEIAKVLSEVSGKREALYELMSEEMRIRRRPGFRHDVERLFDILDDRVESEFLNNIKRDVPRVNMNESGNRSNWERAVEQLDVHPGAGAWHDAKEMTAKAAKNLIPDRLQLPPVVGDENNRVK